jgi:radical SAM protein with 4Fe4S-binding SPASM domain
MRSALELAVASNAGQLDGLRYVEVETSRYCNRTCGWCPNGQSDARREQELLSWTLFAKLVAELGSVNYAGWFAFHNFNEPLANGRLYEEVNHVRAALPAARPAIYTNGDYLNAERFDDLLESGVAYLRVTRYPRDPATLPNIEALEAWLARAGLAAGRTWRAAPVRQGVAMRLEGVDAQVEVIAPTIAGYNDRGGTAVRFGPSVPRTAPCGLTATSLSVDYRGDVKMCCNVVPDVEDHRQYVVGNVGESTLADLWSSPQMDDWRARHGVADWSASPACRTCTQILPETRQ